MPKYSVLTQPDQPAQAVSAEELDRLDVIDLGKGTYHLVYQNKTYRCQLPDANGPDANVPRKQFSVSVNDRTFSVSVADKIDQLVDEMGLTVGAADSSGEIVAPMPGLVIDVLVEIGQQVEAGTPLIILEAMKMENVLKADTDGEVRTVHVAKGAAVDKHALLIELT